jgi:DNA-binding transcriptional ArsR family regulator
MPAQSSLFTISEIATPIRSAILHHHSQVQGPVSAEEVAHSTNIPELTVEREIRSLVRLGLLTLVQCGTASVLDKNALLGVISALQPAQKRTGQLSEGRN